MTQSPATTTIEPKKKPVKEEDYITICNSKYVKVEISSQESTMRITERKNGKVIERLYSRVKDPERIRRIEFQSENWRVHGLKGSYPPIVLEQMDARNKLTGYCKVISKNKANITKHWFFEPEVYAKYTEDDWQYYERRNKK